MIQCVTIPAEFTAGLSFQAAVDAANYPAPAWTVTLHLRGPSQIDLAAAPDSTAHSITAAPAATAAWQPGAYWWVIRATDGADVVEIERGTIEILPDLVAVDAVYDGRTENEIALEAIEAVLGKRATLDQDRYRINNRELYRTSIGDLLKLRSHYRRAVARERRKNCPPTGWGRAIRVEFS